MKHTMRRIGLLALLLLVMGPSRSTLAYGGAFFHTLSKGNRGSDVVALQYLLNIGADGAFGPGTESAVKSFQSSHGLGADGIVGPATWGQLVSTVNRGDSGNKVKALQSLLNAKRSAGLTVDGQFGPGTESAVKSFQSHAGIGADGVVGPTTWKNLIWHYELFNFSGSNMCDQNPDGNASANWGVASSIAQIEKAASDFAAYGRGRLPMGDASFEHGGDIAGHASHEKGVDVDIWPIRTDGQQCTASRITWQSSTYDRTATRALVKSIRAAAPGQIAVIYFNDPVLISEGLTTRYNNHDNHLHVRFK